jgi:hypothetical protein
MEDETLPCSSVTPLFLPISLIMGIPIAFGMPFLFYKLISLHVKELKQIHHATGNKDERWEFRVNTTKNNARTLYQLFERKYKYTKVALIVQKLLVVFFITVLHAVVRASTVTSTILHLMMLMLLGFTQPYISRALDLLSTTTFAAVATLAITGTIVAFSHPVPEGIAIVVVSFLFVAPIGGFIVGWYVTRRKEKRVEAERAALEKKEKKTGKQRKKSHPERPMTAAWTTKSGADYEAKSKRFESSLALNDQTIKAVDRMLDEKTLSYISTAAMILGVLAFVSFTVAIIGLMWARAQSNVYSGIDTSTSGYGDQEQMKLREFAGYGNWAEFSANCCCMRGNEDEQYPMVEVWKCENGFFKERFRSQNVPDGSDLSEHTGLDIRPLCSRTLPCAPVFDSDVGRFIIESACRNLTSSPSEYALEHLW